MFQGAMTAMVTPFHNGQVDFQRLAANVKFQLQQGIDALVPVGTTGESPTVSHEEHKQVIQAVVDAVAASKRKVPVIAGAGSNATSEALELTRFAKQVGADAVLSVVPYYNKPTQEGLYRHFMAVAEVGLPVVLYNIPGRCVVNMTPQTVARLAAHPNIAAIKEATGDLNYASELLNLCDLTVLSGDDSLTLPLMSVGAKGVISVASNLIPKRIKALTAAALAGDFIKARKLHLDLFTLCKVLFIEANPIPLKTAMALAGMDSGELRLPMCEMQASNKAVLEKALRQHGVIK